MYERSNGMEFCRCRRFVKEAIKVLIVFYVFRHDDLGIPFAVFFDFLSGRRREYIFDRRPMNSGAATSFRSSLNSPTTLALRLEKRIWS